MDEVPNLCSHNPTPAPQLLLVFPYFAYYVSVSATKASTALDFVCLLKFFCRAIFTTDLDDTRSDDEGDGQETEDESKRAKKKENRKQK